MRLLALDLDDTLASANSRAEPRVVELLGELEARGWQMMLLSGKPASYVAGFARELGLTRPVIAGENGAVVMASPAYPPEWQTLVEVAPKTRKLLDHVARDIVKSLGGSVWLQPNAVNVSAFWRTPDARKEAIAIVERHLRALPASGLNSYVHKDCVEVVAPGVDKGRALAHAMACLGVERADAVAVGDSANDVPMFAVAGEALGIRMDEGSRRFEDVVSALTWLVDQDRAVSVKAMDAGTREMIAAEYVQQCEDWRHRDAMLWQGLPVSITVTGLLGSVIVAVDIPWLMKAALASLALLVNWLILIMIVKDHWYQHGSSDIMEPIQARIREALGLTDDENLRIRPPRPGYLKEHRKQLKWLASGPFKWLPRASTFKWFIGAQVGLVGLSILGIAYCVYAAVR